MIRRAHQGRAWLPLLAYGLVVAIAVARVILSPPSGSLLPGILLGLAIIAVILFTIALRSADRLRRVRAQKPTAEVFNVAAYPELIEQLKLVSRALGLDPSLARRPGYFTVAIDKLGVSIYGGFWAPRLALSVPASSIEAAASVDAVQGNWILRCVQLLVAGGGSLVVNLCPLQTRWGFPHLYRVSTVEEFTRGASRALGKGMKA